MLNINTFLESLPTSGLGLLGVFIVMAAIYVCIRILCRVLAPNKKEKAE